MNRPGIHSLRRGQLRRDVRGPFRKRPLLEVLEDRLVLSVSWINPSGGDWDTASNWSDDRVPTATDDAVVNLAGITITHATGAKDSVQSLMCMATLDLSAGSMDLLASSTLSMLTVTTGASLSLGSATIQGLTTISGGAFVAAANTTWADVTVNNANLQCDGPQDMTSLSVVNKGLVNHPPVTPTATHSLDLIVSGTVDIDGTSRIDVTNEGYAPGYTTGNTTTGAATGASGGSYAGPGGVFPITTTTDALYGSYALPDDWGSGAAYAYAGGGLIQLEAQTLQLDGQILANGGGPNGGYAPGGSGGSILLTVSTLTGGGMIRAAGGAGYYGDTTGGLHVGSGGGGRVAVYAGDMSGFNLANITAPGGSGPSSVSGGPGTIYLDNTSANTKTLIVDATGGPTTVVTPLDISAGGVTALVVRNGAQVALQPVVTPATLTVSTGASLTLSSDNIQGSTNISGGAFVSATNTTWADVTVNNSTIQCDGPQNMTSLSVFNKGLVNHPAVTSTATHSLDLIVSGTVDIDGTSRIDVTNEGYAPGYTTGNTTTGAATGASGGSYAGPGGVFPITTTTDALYGSYALPDDWGSGAAYAYAGGGLIQLEAQTLQLDGQILANGGGPNGGYAPGGSGGSILLTVSTLTGGGMIRAAGGAGYYGDTTGGLHVGSGGGGRVAVYAGDMSGFNLANITAPGGSGPSSVSGGPGTIYLDNTSANAKTLIVDATGGPATVVTPLDISAGGVTALAVRNGAQVSLQPAATPASVSLTVMSGAILSLSSATIQGSLTVTGGAGVIVSNGLTLDGTATLGNGSQYGYLDFIGTQTLAGNGTVVFAGSSNRNALLLPNYNTTLLIAAGITIHGQTGYIGNDPYLGGDNRISVVNQGTISADGGGTFTLLANNGFSNAGTVQSMSGSSFFVQGGLSNVQGGTLSGGTWQVFDSSTIALPILGIVNNSAHILLTGVNPRLLRADGSDALGTLSENDAGGILELLNGARATLGQSLENAGTLVLSGTLPIKGAYQQDSSGSLEVDLYGPPQTGAFGQISATGAATLGGTLDISVPNGYTPSAGASYPVLLFGSENGNFATITGLSLGRSQVWQTALNPTDFVVAAVVSVSDLAVTSVRAPLSGTSGQNVTITYSVTNQSNNPTIFTSWVDSVYLAQGTVLDPYALLIGRVEHVGAEAGHASYSETLTAPLPGVVPGQYHIIVECGSQGFVPDSSPTNDRAAAPDPITVDVPVLTPGVTFSGTVASGQDEYFRVDLPAGPVAQITANFASAAGGALFEQFQNAPNQATYDQLAFDPTSEQQQMVLNGTHAGTYYLLAQGRQASGTGQPFSITVQELNFQVLSISPNQASNVGPVTISVFGSGLTQHTSVSLVSSNGVHYAASKVVLPNPAIFIGPVLVQRPPGLQATFDLTFVAAGAYDVLVQDGSLVNKLAGAFTVTSTPPGNVTFSLDGPQTIRPYQPGTYLTLEYKNTGDTELPAPVVTIEAQNALLGSPIQGLPPASLSFISSSSGGGVTYLQTFQGASSIEIVCNDPTGPGGNLPPGYDGFYTIPFQPSTFGAHVVSSFSLLVPPQADTPIDWASQKDSLRPSIIPADAWDAIFANFTARVGETYGQFEQVLQEDANYLSQVGEAVTDPSQLLGFELQQDADPLPMPTLSTSIDATAPAPGLPLLFGRMFVQSIAGRYQLGPLGRGWADTWDMTVTADASNDVTIAGGGAVHVFTIGPEGAYQAAPGDYGTLTLQNGDYTFRDKQGTVYVFLPDGLLSYEQDSNGNRITATYNGNQLTSLTDSDGQSFGFAYNALGLISQLADEAGRITTYTYDSANEELLSVAGPSGTTSYTYDNGNNVESLHALLSIANADGTHEYFQYDSQGRLIGQSQDGGANAITYAYDVGPGGYRVIDALGNSTTVLLNDAGETAQVIDALDGVTNYSYDAGFNLVQIVAPTGITTSYKYDSQGNITQEVDPLGNTINMTYDPTSSRLTSLRDARGNTTQYSYDNQGNLLDITYPDNTVHQFSYDPMGNLAQSVDQNGNAIASSYNAQGLVMQETFADGSQTNFTYDTQGNMLTATDSIGTITMQYDSANDLTMISYPDGLSLKYSYDSGGRRSRMVDQSGFTVNYSYDSVGRLAELTDGNGNLIVAYAYDSTGRLTQKDMANGTRTTYAYDADGNVLSITNYAPDHVTVNSFDDYTYDAMGNALADTNQDGQWTYTYDADSQLVHAVFAPNNTDPDGLTAQDLQYDYDPAGNRVSVTENGVMTVYTTNNMNEYTSVGAASYSYDANGNLTSIVNGPQLTFFMYNDMNKLVSAVTPSGSSTYQYDPLGDLVATTANGQSAQYLVDPTGSGEVTGEYDGVGNLIAHYTYGLGLTSRVDTTGTSAFYDFNAAGSTVGLTDAVGGYASTYSYLPFGEILRATQSVPNPFTYVGQSGVMGNGKGLQPMRARFYSPAQGRFVQPDPLGVPISNLYEYAINNPLEFFDPSGLLFNQFERYAKALQQNANARSEAVNNAENDAVRNAATDEINRSGKEVNRLAPSAAIELFFTNTVAEIGGTILELWTEIESIHAVGSFVDVWHLNEVKEKLEIPEQQDGAFQSQQRTPGDPNDITGPGGFGPDGYVAPDQAFPYTIQFQNEPTATAPAQVVRVTETLDPNLDWSTFQLGNFGFGDIEVQVPQGLSFYSARLDLRSTLGLFVDVTAGLDLTTGIVTWTLTSIDPTTLDLPSDILSGFLPPDVSPPEGEAFLNYMVRPKATDPTDTVVNAKATVVFDAGLPDQSSLDTAPIYNTIDAGAPASSVAPLRSNENATSFTVTWSGQDDTGGSGIASFNIFASDNGGAYMLWQSDTTETSATFTGVYGHSYSFYSVATDNAGIVETSRGSPQAHTIVAGPPTSSVNALPAVSTTTSFTVSWSGSPGEGASSIASYSIFDSEDGGPFTVFLTNTKATSATFTGQPGHSYGFYSVATDNLGLVQPTPSSAQATTKVKPTPPTPPPPAPPPPLVTVTKVVDKLNKKHQVMEVDVSFSGLVNFAEAQALASYRLATPGKKNSYTAKNAGVIKLGKAVYNASTNTVALKPKKPFAITKPVQLLVYGTGASALQDGVGRDIDGDYNGRAGGNAIAILGKNRVTVNTAFLARTGVKIVTSAAVDALLDRGDFAGLWGGPGNERGKHTH
jgi:RHS repeat-associated protein